MGANDLAGTVSNAAGEPDPWRNRVPVPDRGGSGYARLITATREFQEALSAANPPSGVSEELAADLDRISGRLAQFAESEIGSPIGTRLDLPGRGHPLLLPFIVDEWTDFSVRGRVTFGRFYLGGNGAAHGGTLPLLFDEVMGRLNSGAGRKVGRTAYLHVNYRHITPIGRELHLDVSLDRVEGRKRYVTAQLRDEDVIVSDAEGLFVELRPGQP